MNAILMPSGLTLFIPLYNEDKILKGNVLRLLQYMDPLELPYEVILGSNGSTDRTPEIGHELDHANHQINFFHIELRGPGLAFAEALGRAKYACFVCLDADLSIEMGFIDRALKALEGNAAVIGFKHLVSQKRPLVRILASEFFIACTNLLLHMPYRDYSIGAKAYRTEVIRPFIDKVDRHTFYTQQILYELLKRGERIVEIPVSCDDRRKSKFNLLYEGFYRYGKLFDLWLRNFWK